MSGLPILDLVVGLIFIFFLLSIITSSAVEVILTVFQIRAKMLGRWLKSVFDKAALLPDGSPNTRKEKQQWFTRNSQVTNEKKVKLGEAIMNHCMTTVLSPNEKPTTYIKSSDFVNAFLDQVTRLKKDDLSEEEKKRKFQDPPATLSDYIERIKETPVLSDELRRTVLALAYEASRTATVLDGAKQNPLTQIKSDIELFKEKLENWYDSNAERLVGRLKKRWAVPFTAGLALIIAVGLNADAFETGRYLYDHQEAAKTIADQATATISRYKDRVDQMRDTNPGVNTSKEFSALDTAVQRFHRDVADYRAKLPKDFPIGWKNGLFGDPDWGRRVPGWLATVLAIMVGAPFWFDLLNKIVNIRAAGPKPASSLGDTKGNTTINS